MAAAAQGDRRTSRWQQTAGSTAKQGRRGGGCETGRFELRDRALDGSLRVADDLAVTVGVLSGDGRPNGVRFPAKQNRGGGAGQAETERGRTRV